MKTPKRPWLFPAVLVIGGLVVPGPWEKPLPAKGCGNLVEIRSSQGSYQLFVNGCPFYIKGVGVGKAFGWRGDNYLKLAKTLGANTVRTWGIDQGDRSYLDEAAKRELFVCAGIWINYADERGSVSYLSDENYRNSKEREVLDYVRRFKDHPAILLWNIGNEAIAFTKSEAERIALAKFLETLIQKVHAEDPRHPVVYASAGSADLPYLKRFAPSLDVVGMNEYGSVLMAQSRWAEQGFKAPYLITEFGPAEPGQLSKDTLGRTVEPGDPSKAAQYRNHWNLICERRGKNIGGVAFQLGESSQTSLTYWNLNDHSQKKESFLLMEKLYKELRSAVGHAPRIVSFDGVPRQVRHGSVFKVTLMIDQGRGGGPYRYAFRASTAIEDAAQYTVNRQIPLKVLDRGCRVRLVAPNKAGFYRIYALVRDRNGNVSVVNRAMQVL